MVRPLRNEEWIAIPEGPKAFWVSASLPDGSESETAGYIISFQDLTEITRLEEEVRLKDRMAAMGRMAAGIAHEIRNP
jgi:signal transduction histidine kinase